MSPEKRTGKPMFRVIDAMGGPHSGHILRVRFTGGRTPTLREMKGSSFRARSPNGAESSLKVVAFSMIGGKPSDARFTRTGRLDLLVELDPGSPPVDLQWTLTGPE